MNTRDESPAGPGPADSPFAARSSGSGQTIARNSLWLLLDTAVTTVATLAASIAVARVLGPDRLGYYNYLTWIAATARLIADVGVPLATRKFASELRGRGDLSQLRALMDATARFQRIMASVLVAVAVSFVFVAVPRQHWPYAFITAVGLGPSILIGIPSALLWSTENLGPNTRASLLATSVNLGGTVISLALGWGLTGLAGSLLTSRLLDLFVRSRLAARAYATLPASTGPLSRDLRQRLVRFCWAQSVLIVLDVIIWNRSELLFLERFTDIRQVAFYSQAFNLIQQLLVLPMALSASAGVTLMVKQGQAPGSVGRLAGTALWFVALFSVPATLGVAALASPIMRVMYGTQYLAAIPVLAVSAFFGMARALSYPILEFLIATERQRFIVRWSVVIVPINLGLAWWLIPTGGAVSGAIAGALTKGITHVLTVTGLWVYAVRTVGLKAPLGRFARLLAASLLMMLTVRTVTQPLAPALGLALGVPLGVALMVGLLRLAGCTDGADAQRLMSLQRMIPGPVRGIYMRLVRVVCPTALAS